MRAVICASAAIMWLMASNAYASFSSCEKPDPPSCSQTYGNFDDDDDFQQCRREMESYKSDAEEYLSCIQREAKKAATEVTDEYNDAVSAFNRRAGQ